MRVHIRTLYACSKDGASESHVIRLQNASKLGENGWQSLQNQAKMKSTKVQTLGELRMRDTAN